MEEKRIIRVKDLLMVVLIMVLLIIFTVLLVTRDANTYTSTKSTSISGEGLAIMLETDVLTGIYEQTSSTSWPSTDEYTFNEDLSYCEKGSTMIWNEDSNSITVSTDTADKCWVYFDVYVFYKDCNDDSLACYIASSYTDDGENSLYYFDGSGSYTNADLEADDLSYRFSGGDYVLTDKATDAGYTTISNIRTTSDTVITSTGFINFYCNDTLYFVGYGCSSSYDYYYTLDYDTTSTKYYTYSDVLNKAISDGYLEDGNINNYICFGGDDCTDINNLYRIIGVFQNDSGEYEVKLMKFTYASSGLLGTDGDYNGTSNYFLSALRYSLDGTYIDKYYWNKINYDTSYSEINGYVNVWYYSALNTVNLNTNYLNSIGNTWSNLITTHTWIVAGGTKNVLRLS